jgi:4-aminobutyrate aminotransferase/(S)-3-amino-2-methylpropionate transaminase
MTALEFVKDGDPRQPNKQLCAAIVTNCANEGLIVLSAGAHKNVIRVLSPLVITNEQLEQGLNILEKVIKEQVNK